MTPDDLVYVQTWFCRLPALCAARDTDPEEALAEIAAGRLPRPSYVLPDGSAWFPADLFALAAEAGGTRHLPELFRTRYLAAAAAEGQDPSTVDGCLADYLSGDFGVCLRRASPEAMVKKELLVLQIGGLLAEPRPEDPTWGATLRTRVDVLDRLTRPFTSWDRIRFGGPVSRDRCIDAPRRRWPELLSSEPGRAAPGVRS